MDADKENFSCSSAVDTRLGWRKVEPCVRADRAPFTSLPANGLSGDLNCASCDALRSRVTRAEARTGDTLEKIREARDEISQLRRAHSLAEEATAAAERAKTILSQKAHEECMLVEEEQHMLKRAERKWREEVDTLQSFCSDAQQSRAEARELRDAAEELHCLRAVHKHSLEEHLSERMRWQEEVASMAADFRDLRELAANAARLPATLQRVEEQAAEQCFRLRNCEDELQRLHRERASGLEAEGELRVARLEAAQQSQEWCEASITHERQLRREEMRTARLESRLGKLELELETASRISSSAPRTGSRRARWQRSQSSSVTTDRSFGIDECVTLPRHCFENGPALSSYHRSGRGVSNALDVSVGAASVTTNSTWDDYEPWAFASQRREVLR